MPNTEEPVFSLPSLDTVQQQVKQNPHETPMALVEFGQSLGKAMELALKNEAYATRLFGELESCARESGSKPKPVAIQAQCIMSAGRLAGKHGTLLPRYKDLYSQASPAIRKLIENMDRLAQ